MKSKGQVSRPRRGTKPSGKMSNRQRSKQQRGIKRSSKRHGPKQKRGTKRLGKRKSKRHGPKQKRGTKWFRNRKSKRHRPKQKQGTKWFRNRKSKKEGSKQKRKSTQTEEKESERSTCTQRLCAVLCCCMKPSREMNSESHTLNQKPRKQGGNRTNKRHRSKERSKQHPEGMNSKGHGSKQMLPEQPGETKNRGHRSKHKSPEQSGEKKNKHHKYNQKPTQELGWKKSKKRIFKKKLPKHPRDRNKKPDRYDQKQNEQPGELRSKRHSCEQEVQAKQTGERNGTTQIQTELNINQRAREYHDKHARPPKTPQKDPNFKDFNSIADKIYEELHDQDLATQRVHVGSVYKRTNIQKVSDFDTLLIKMDPSITATKHDGLGPGYAVLTKDEMPISPVDYIDSYKGKVQKILNVNNFGDVTVKLRDHGPALSADVHDKTTGQFQLSVDLVPSLQLKDGTSYVAKFPKSDREEAKENNAWFESYSIEAREKLATADVGNKCHREVNRTCKVIRNSESNLHHITSYQLKSAMMHVMDTSQSDWDRKYIGDRTREVVDHVQAAYRSGVLPDYFIPDKNLLEQTGDRTRKDTANRLAALSKNPHKMFPIKEE